VEWGFNERTADFTLLRQNALPARPRSTPKAMADGVRSWLLRKMRYGGWKGGLKAMESFATLFKMPRAPVLRSSITAEGGGARRGFTN
jgi:hypothetical protein